MSEWRDTTIAAVADIAPGQSPAGRDLNEAADGMPFYQGSRDFGRRYPSRRVFTTAAARTAKSGDVLLSVRAPVGAVNRAAEDCAIGRGVMALRGKDGASTSYLYYVLRSLEAKWRQFESAGSVFSNLSRSNLAGVPIRVPPEEVQKSIVDVLEAIDNSVEQDEAAVRALRDLASSLLHVANAKTTEREAVSLREVASIAKGVSYRSVDLRDAKNALVSLKCFGRTGDFQPDGLKPFAGEYKTAHVVDPVDTVVAQTDLTQGAEVVGRALRIPSTERFDRLVASMDLAIVRPASDRVTPEFLFAVLSSERFRQHCRARANGTTVLHLPTRAIADYRFGLPDRRTVDHLSTAMRSIWDQMDAIVSRMATTERLAELALPELITGRWLTADRQNGNGVDQ